MNNKFKFNTVMIKEIKKEISIDAFKIIFNTIKIIKNKYYPEQLKMFEEENNSENNTYVRITLPNNLISNNLERVTKAYKELSLFKYDFYISKNSLGKKVEFIGGFVTNVVYDNEETSFLLNSYWLKKIINIIVYSNCKKDKNECEYRRIFRKNLC